MPLPLVYIFTVAIAGLAGYLYIDGKPKKVFISYYSKGDSHYKNLIMAWAKNNKFKLNIEDKSTDTKIQSNDKNYLKRKMREQIEKASHFIVFIGEDTHEREWVSWEIEQAKKFGKKIIAVKENRHFKSPKPLLNSGATWVYGFTEDGLRNALNQ